jgi:NosR/NirI family transcriptional regulator, nitrous oxide reductase regulator
MKCKYGAIERTGQIDYDECFQCLDCVALYENPRKCFALVRAAERAKALGASIRSPVGPNT